MCIIYIYIYYVHTCVCVHLCTPGNPQDVLLRRCGHISSGPGKGTMAGIFHDWNHDFLWKTRFRKKQLKNKTSKEDTRIIAVWFSMVFQPCLIDQGLPVATCQGYIIFPALKGLRGPDANFFAHLVSFVAWPEWSQHLIGMFVSF